MSSSGSRATTSSTTTSAGWVGATRRDTSRPTSGTHGATCSCPSPSFDSFAALNEYLAACCFADLFRRVRGKPDTKAERLEVDRAAMLALPGESFEPRRVAQASANTLSLVRFDRNDYSVPTDYAHHDVTCIGGIDRVTFAVGTETVATHPRCWDTEQVRFDPVHYLALLERKPGALDHARPLEGWTLPGSFAVLRRRLEADLGSAGTREFIKVLRLLEKAGLAELTAAVEEALAIGATGSDRLGTSSLLHEGAFALSGELSPLLWTQVFQVIKEGLRQPCRIDLPTFGDNPDSLIGHGTSFPYVDNRQTRPGRATSNLQSG